MKWWEGTRGTILVEFSDRDRTVVKTRFVPSNVPWWQRLWKRLTRDES